MYKFDFKLNDADYFEFNKFHVNSATSNKRAVLMIRLFLPVVLLIILLLRYLKEDIILMISMLISFTFVSVLWVLMIKPLLFLFLQINIKLLKMDGKMPYAKEVSVCFEDDQCIEITEIAESKIRYSAIEKIGIGRNAVYLYFGAVQALIIPFFAFADEEQKRTFLEFIRSKIKAEQSHT